MQATGRRAKRILIQQNSELRLVERGTQLALNDRQRATRAVRLHDGTVVPALGLGTWRLGEARRSLADINDELDDEDDEEFALPAVKEAK